MAAKDRFKNKNCFIPFTVPEWKTDETYTIRALTPDEHAGLTAMYNGGGDDKELNEKCLYYGFSLFFADEAGNRIYSDDDILEIKANIPILVVKRVSSAGLDFTRDDLKKN